MQVEEDEKVLMSREDAMNQIATLTGGRTAEETGVRIDHDRRVQRIEKATRIARGHGHAVRHERAIRHGGARGRDQQYLGGDTSLACRRRRLPASTRRSTKSSARRTSAQGDPLKDMDALNRLAEALLQSETLTGEEFMKILSEE
jgi:cell division protease FtsH